MEDKQQILNLLLPALQATRNLSDLVNLKLDPTKEMVIATFESGSSKVANVAADSGISMIRDVIKKIV